MQVHEGFGKRGFTFGKRKQLAATSKSNIHECYRVCFSHQTAQEKRHPLGHSQEKKPSAWWGGGTDGSCWMSSILPSSRCQNRGEIWVFHPERLDSTSFLKSEKEGEGWNQRRWQWRQQERLCSGFTILSQQTLSMVPRRSSYSSRADDRRNTSPVWCSALAAGPVNNMLIRVPLNINVNGCGGCWLTGIPLNISTQHNWFHFTILIEIISRQRPKRCFNPLMPTLVFFSYG